MLYNNDKNSPSFKAFAVLKKNINIWDMKDLIQLLESHIDEEVQKTMMEEVWSGEDEE